MSKKSHTIGLEVIKWVENLCSGLDKLKDGVNMILKDLQEMDLEIGLFAMLILNPGTHMLKFLQALAETMIN